MWLNVKEVLNDKPYIWRRIIHVCDVGVSSLTKCGAQLECVSAGGPGVQPASSDAGECVCGCVCGCSVPTLRDLYPSAPPTPPFPRSPTATHLPLKCNKTTHLFTFSSRSLLSVAYCLPPTVANLPAATRRQNEASIAKSQLCV